MKNFFILFLSVFSAVSCDDNFTLRGTVASQLPDGESAYVKYHSGGREFILDSCKVLHGAFEMHASVDSAFLAALYIGNVPILPFVVEPGDVEVNITPNSVYISGTPLNNRLDTFMRNKSLLEARMEEFERLEMSMILDGHTAEAAAVYVSDSISAIGRSMEMFMDRSIREHFDNVLGPCLFALMYSAMPVPVLTPELESLFADAPPTFREDVFVKMFYDAAQENTRRMSTD